MSSAAAGSASAGLTLTQLTSAAAGSPCIDESVTAMSVLKRTAEKLEKLASQFEGIVEELQAMRTPGFSETSFDSTATPQMELAAMTDSLKSLEEETADACEHLHVRDLKIDQEIVDEQKRKTCRIGS